MIVRHDIDPQRYLIDPAQFPAVVAVASEQEEVPIAYDNIDRMLKPSLISESQMLPEVCDRTDGMGSLIAPQWILTAAQVAVDISVTSAIAFTGKRYTVQQIVIHPEFCHWNEATRQATNDIALLRLDRPVEGVKPLLLHRKMDELGQTMTFVGSGDFGNGLIGPNSVDARLRMATNRVALAEGEWLVCEFDAPPDTTELEGVGGPGDSGGPALLRVEDRWAIAGVSTGQHLWPLAGGEIGEGYYGAMEYCTRVSQYLDWIKSVVDDGPS